MKRHGLRNLLVLVPLCFSLAVYFSLTGGYFFGDDFHVLYWLANNGPAEFFLAPYGGHVQITRNVMFFAVERLAGTDPAPYFWVTLLTHLLNVALLFFVVRALTGSARLACFGAALWGTSPLDEGALSWLAVYGHVVAATPVLVILLRVAAAAERGTFPSRSERAVWTVLALTTGLSFGVGVGAAMALPFVIALLLPRPAGRSLLRTPLLGVLVVLPVLYLIVNLLYSHVSGRPVGSVVPLGTFLSTPSVTAAAVVHLIAYGITQLLLGFTYTPGQYPDATAAAVLLLFAGATSAALARSSPAQRRQTLAVALLVLANYGMIALGRGIFFAAGGEYASQPRYHYLGAVYLTLAVCLLLRRAGAWSFAGERLKNGLVAGWVCATLIAWRATGWDFDHHVRDRRAVERVLWNVRAAIAKHPRGADVYIENRPFGRFGHFVGMEDFPGWAALFAIYFPDNVVAGRRVHFVETDPDVRAAAARGRRTGTLLVAQKR